MQILNQVGFKVSKPQLPLVEPDEKSATILVAMGPGRVLREKDGGYQWWLVEMCAGKQLSFFNLNSLGGGPPPLSLGTY